MLLRLQDSVPPRMVKVHMNNETFISQLLSMFLVESRQVVLLTPAPLTTKRKAYLPLSVCTHG